METFMKLNSQTAGRDKLFRLMQYLSRFIWHRLEHQEGNKALRLRSLEYSFSTFRKLLRLGKCIEALYSVLPIINHPDMTVRFTVSLSKISNSLFLLFDHILWIGRSGVYEVDLEKWTKLSNKYWLMSITMNLVRDVYEILQIVQNESSLISPQAGCRTVNELLTLIGNVLVSVQSHKDVMVDTIKNCCDFFIPLTALGYTKLSPSMIGGLGVISSIAGLMSIMDPKCKLVPM